MAAKWFARIRIRGFRGSTRTAGARLLPKGKTRWLSYGHLVSYFWPKEKGKMRIPCEPYPRYLEPGFIPFASLELARRTEEIVCRTIAASIRNSIAPVCAVEAAVSQERCHNY